MPKKDIVLKKKWLEAIEQIDGQTFHTFNDYIDICSLHFDSGCFLENRKLKYDAIPTMFR